MKKRWPKFSDIFAFQPPPIERGRNSFESINDDRLDDENGPPEESSDLFENPQAFSVKETWNKIRFDNSVRLLIAVPTYVASVFMWLSGSISSLLPMTLVFTFFGATQFFITWFFQNNRFARNLDYVMSTFDLISMSVAIYCTGGTSSPFYFIYFIPLIVHAFHRDWALVLFNGIGGSLLYASAILNSFSEFSSANLTNLGTQLFFMFLTLGIIHFAVRLLRKKDEADHLRLQRLLALSLIGRRLNQASALSELPIITTTLVKLVNEGLGGHLETWTRFLLLREDPLILRAVPDSAPQHPEFKQEISSGLCPAIKFNRVFSFEELGQSSECPVENFSFGSHICFPITGTENETFGVLFSGSSRKQAFGNEEKEFLQYVARSLALSIQRLQRMEELKKAVEMNSCVMATYIGSSRSLPETYRSIVEGIATVLKADQVTLMIWDNHDLVLRTIDIFGSESNQSKSFLLQMGEGLEGRSLEHKQPICEQGALCLPLITLRGEPLGTITAIRIEDKNAFSKADVDTAYTFSTRAALAIENATLHENEKAQLEQALKTSQQKAA